MTSQEKTAEAMTDTELIEAVAVDVMGWRRGNDDGFEDEDAWYEEGEDDPIYSADGCDKPNGITAWRPTTDWSNWRKVEEKMMKSAELIDAFSLDKHWTNAKGTSWMQWYMSTSLRTRCEAALRAVRSLKKP